MKLSSYEKEERRLQRNMNRRAKKNSASK